MTMASPRGSVVMLALPRSFSSIVVSIGGLAMFVIFGSWFLVSNPIGLSVNGYLYDNSRKEFLPELNRSEVDVKLNEKGDGALYNTSSGADIDRHALGYAVSSNTSKENEVDQHTHGHAGFSDGMKENEADASLVSSDIMVDGRIGNARPSGLPNDSAGMGGESDGAIIVQASSDTKLGDSRELSPLPDIATKTDSLHSGCDLYHGNWFYDSAGPSYTNDSCPVMTQMQNCQGNGRPDKDYENWRWKPFQCDLPRFDGREFLELMRGKTLAFVGDSVARNQMESLLCLLWQVEVPKNRGNKKMHRWEFKSTSTMIIRIWSSWLVHRTSEKFDYAPEGIDKLHLDVPDEYFFELIPTFDVLVLSSGHWFAKQSVYILNNEIVGSQLWSPPTVLKVNNINAFSISVETVLAALATHPNYTGLTILRSFSPDHYEGGEWNTGGSCTGKATPLAQGELVENGFTNVMREKQAMGFDRAVKRATNKAKLRRMDITEAFGYRHDGHPGPYRSKDPNKVTRRRSDGRPPPQDCLHWCMPGPVDTWNELVLEIVRREL